MRPRQWFTVSLTLPALLWVFSANGQQTTPAEKGTKVIVSPDRLTPGETTKITVTVDVTTLSGRTAEEIRRGVRPRPDGVTDPVFTVSVPAGAGILTPVTITSGGNFVSTSSGDPKNSLQFRLDRVDDEGPRATGVAELTFTTDPGLPPGEIQVNVQGSQGLVFLNVRPEVSAGFTGSGRLFVIPAPTPPPKDSALPGGGTSARPPLAPTTNLLNPTPQMVNRAIQIAILLGALVLINHTGTRRRPPPEATQEPAEPESPGDEELTTGNCRVWFSADGPHYGNASGYIKLTVEAIDIRNDWRATVLPLTVNLSSNGRDEYRNFGKPIKYYDGARVDYQIPIPWEWEVVDVTFSLLGVSVELTPQPGLAKGNPTKLTFGRPANTPTATNALPGQTRSVTVRVHGANPKVVVQPTATVIDATGRNSTTLNVSEFWLFGQRQRLTGPTTVDLEEKSDVLTGTETLVIKNITGRVGDESFPKPENQAHAAADAWIAPFLVRSDDSIDVVALNATCWWTGGALSQRAMKAQRGNANQVVHQGPPRVVFQASTKRFDLECEPCEVHLRGCTAKCETVTSRFWPLPGTPLYAKGWLLTQKGDLVPNPFTPAAYANPAVRSQRARITCQVLDISQGPNTDNIIDCKVPPRHGLDVPGDPRKDGGPEIENLFALAHREKLEDLLLKAMRPDNLRVHEVAVDDSGSVEFGNLYTTEVRGGPLRFQYVEHLGPGGVKTIELATRIPIVYLGKYSVRPENDPVHDGPVIYTLTVDDGLGGRVEVRGACRVVLGLLAMDTLVPDSRIYETQPHLFEVEHQPGKGYRPVMGESTKVKITWEFAMVDKEGSPVASAVPTHAEKRNPTEADLNSTSKFHIIVGDTPTHYSEIFIDRDQGNDVRRFRTGEDAAKAGVKPGNRYVHVETEDRIRSWNLRGKWHDLQKHDLKKRFSNEELALRWLPIPGEKTREPRPWKDTTLSLAVRVEMRDLNGNLLATSDRFTGGGGRTPPEFVWRDHRFLYVLHKLRLLLVDHLGFPYAKRKYELTAGSQRLAYDNTEEHGVIEVLAPADAESATLTLLDDYEGAYTLSLKMGCLDPDVTDGVSAVKARLNNLGFFAGETADDKANDASQPVGKTAHDKELYQRAVFRFQTAYQLKMDLDQEPPKSLAIGAEGRGEMWPLNGPTLEKLRALDTKFESHNDNLPAAPTPGNLQVPPAPQPPSTRELVTTRFGESDPILNPLCPYPPWKLMRQRECRVALHMPTTIRIPHDSDSPHPKRWFPTLVTGNRECPNPSNTKGKEVTYRIDSPKIHEGNQVTYLIDSPKAFKSMVEAILKAIDSQSPKRFIYLIGYSLNGHAEIQMVPREDWKKMWPDSAKRFPKLPEATVLGLFTVAAFNGVQVRALLWESATAIFKAGVPPNLPHAEYINDDSKVPQGAAILDNRHLYAGTHHQKILIVHDGKELMAFCGGMDLANWNVGPHDVHCQIQGPAAYDLLKIFCERWKDHGPVAEGLDKQKGPLYGKDLSKPKKLPAFPDSQYVQIGRTYPNGKKHGGKEPVRDSLKSSVPEAVTSVLTDAAIWVTGFAGYGFAEEGEFTARELILHALSHAKRFVYIEDQYLTNMEVCDQLKKVLPHLKHVTMLIPDDSIVESLKGQAGFRRRQFIKRLKEGEPDPNKVRVFVRRLNQKPNYVHSKLYIIDDELAIIGSVNCNRRSFTYDSEVMAATCNQAIGQVLRYNLAHRLRIALWAEHLQMDTPAGHAELADGVASVVHWRELPSNFVVKYHDEAAPNPATVSDEDWNNVIDPVGS